MERIRRRRSRTSTLKAWTSHLLVVIHVLPLCISFADDSSGEELRATYLVLMEGEAAAFLHFSHQSQEELVRLNNTRRKFKGREEGEVAAVVSQVIETHDRVLEKTLDAGSYNKLYSFHHVIHGFAVHTTASQAKRLKSAEGVVLMEKDRSVKLMTTYTPHFLGLPEEGLWWDVEKGRVPEPDRSGEGVVIGFVDTGIDPTHPSFAYDPRSGTTTTTTCEVGPMFPVGSCNGKIVSARYFCTGAAKVLPIDPSKDLSPFDQIGHGSHVASIAAGNHGVPVVVNGFNYGYASGMAPAARIAVYKALYPAGGSLADVIAAIDQAIRDGVDVLTLSIGPDEPPEDVPTFMSIFDITLLLARRAGVFVAQAAGNRGPGRSTVVSYSPWSVAVASGSTDRDYNGTVVFGHGNHHHHYHHHHHHVTGVGLSGPTSGNGNLKFKLVAAKDCLPVSGINKCSFTQEYAEECQHAEALRSNLVKGSIVICNFSTGFANGTSSVIGLVNTAATLGFMGFVLVANPRYGDLVTQPLPFNIPGIVIPKVENVKMLINYYEKHTERDKRGNAIEFNGRASILEGRVATFDADTSIFVSRFSSRGPDIMDSNLNIPADVLKPEILAPGHQIWAAWSPTSARDPFLQGYNFALMSGTSMSTPHVSGIAALLKQLKPTWTPSMISSAMSTTASKLDYKGKAIMSQGFQLNTLYSSTPFDLGAGMINPSKSLDPGLVFYSGFEDYVAFLCSLPNLNPSRIRKTTGRSCSNNTTIKLLSPSDLNLPSITVSNLNGSLQVQREIINVADVAETYLISVLEPSGVKVQIIPSSFTILPEGRQNLIITLKVGEHVMGDFSFGEIVLTGSLDHIVRMPLSVRSTSLGS